MSQTLSAVLLAGTLRPSPLREALDVPVVSLPMGPEGTVLDTWLRVLAGIDGLSDVRVVLNTKHDADVVRGASTVINSRKKGSSLNVTVLAEPSAWRGVAGLLRDITDDLPDTCVVLAGEAHGLPPQALAPIIAAMNGEFSGCVGIAGNDEPSGAYAFTRQALARIPRVGYCDMKEQFLPMLAESESRVRTARVADGVQRIRDRRSYLAAMRECLAKAETAGSQHRVSKRASISGSAVLAGRCAIEGAAVIEDGAVIHDSVVLDGATIGGGAVVSRSIVGPLASVPARSKLVREIVFDPSAMQHQSQGRRVRAAR